MISIFSAEGTKLEIAETIRKHLPDEVNDTKWIICTISVTILQFQINKDDVFPKFVCVGCWVTLESFRKFYDAVNGARHSFLLKFVKNQMPEFCEVLSDAAAIAEEFFPIKDEQIDDVFVENNKSAASEGNISGDSATQDIGKIGDDIFDNEDSFHRDSDSDQNDVGNVSEDDASLRVSNGMAGNAKNRKLDHLIPEYLDMNCSLCAQPFETLSDASKHYRRQHNQGFNSIRMKAKCCLQDIPFYHSRDHIQFHLDPEYFK